MSILRVVVAAFLVPLTLAPSAKAAISAALERERESESYFRFMAERVPDTKLGCSWSWPRSSGRTRPICSQSTTQRRRRTAS